jgi:PIN domain nuclease of toxin-antitoxin system
VKILLLDTQAFLWFVTDDSRLSPVARAAIEDSGNHRFLSIASIWEMAIKHSIGKLHFTEPFDQFIRRQMAINSINPLSIAVEHAIVAALLPLHHRDPFDRMLIAQARHEKMNIVSSDVTLDRYEASRIW